MAHLIARHKNRSIWGMEKALKQSSFGALMCGAREIDATLKHYQTGICPYCIQPLGYFAVDFFVFFCCDNKVDDFKYA